MPRKVAGDVVEVYGFLNKHSPYIGYFHYSPTQSRNLNLFFADNVISTQEMERRKKIKNHPFTGCFHFAPGKFSDLHGLERYRPASPANPIAPNAGADKFAMFCEKMEKSYEIESGGIACRVNRSKDDSSIISTRVLPRCLSDESRLKAYVRYHKSGGDANDLMHLGTRRLTAENSDSDPSHLTSRHQRRIQKQVELRTTNVTRETNDAIISKERSGSLSSYETPLRKKSPPPSAVPSGSTSVLLPTLADSVPRIQLTEPQKSWQVHSDEGVSGFGYDQNRIKDMSRKRFAEKYRLHVDKVMGEGSFARVMLATNRQNNTFVAVKIINKTAHNSVEEEIRFRNEIDNQSRLWHHNICTIIDVYESLNHIYIVLDYCPGGTLDQMLELRRRLDEEETRFIAYQLFAGMTYMHENGVLHGDIKPGNIIFQPPSVSNQDSSSNSIGVDNRVDLLYEKKRREGTLTISLNQAPVVDYDAMKRSGSGSDGTRARAVKSQTELDIAKDANTALLRERVVKGGDIMALTPSKPRRTRSVTSGVDEPQLGGGALGFASAAHRNTLRKKMSSNNVAIKKKAETTEDVVLSAEAAAANSFTMPSMVRPRRASSTSNADSVGADDSTSDAPTKPAEVSSRHRTYSCSDSGAGSIEVDERYQGHIRYKCPYGMLLKLCDFGLSQKIPDVKHFRHTGDVHKAPYTPGGTEGYLAPEVLQHKPYGLAADLWAVGTVLYKCLSGNLPFVPATACLTREVKFNGPAWRKVSESCKQLIQSLLTVEEGGRLSAKQCLDHEWFSDILLISTVIIPGNMDMANDQEV